MPVFPFYSAEVRLYAEAITPQGGYVKLTVKNMRTTISVQNPTTGCPPPTNCVGPLTVKVGDTLKCTGTLYKCDDTTWAFADIGARPVLIKTGACGYPNMMDINLVSTTVVAQGTVAGFSVDFQISQNVVDWISSQIASGYAASVYAHVG